MSLMMLTFEMPIPAQFAETLGSQISSPSYWNCGMGVFVGRALVAVGLGAGRLVGTRVGARVGVAVAVSVGVGVAV